jgi:DNA-binding response OmpR family regulator
VLVVDDESSLRRAASRVLERAGYVVLQAADGSEALRALAADAPPIDLVVADLFMPGIDGLELRRRAVAAGPTPPFLFTSGCSESEATARAAGDGAFAFIAKPWTPSQLVERVRSILSGNTSA